MPDYNREKVDEIVLALMQPAQHDTARDQTGENQTLQPVLCSNGERVRKPDKDEGIREREEGRREQAVNRERPFHTVVQVKGSCWASILFPKKGPRRPVSAAIAFRIKGELSFKLEQPEPGISIDTRG